MTSPTRLSCGCRFDDSFLPVCAEHLCEKRRSRDYTPQWVGGTWMTHKVCETHPSLVAAFVSEARRAK